MGGKCCASHAFPEDVAKQIESMSPRKREQAIAKLTKEQKRDLAGMIPDAAQQTPDETYSKPLSVTPAGNTLSKEHIQSVAGQDQAGEINNPALGTGSTIPHSPGTPEILKAFRGHEDLSPKSGREISPRERSASAIKVFADLVGVIAEEEADEEQTNPNLPINAFI